MVILKIKITLILLNPTGIGQSSKIGGLERLKKSGERRATVYDY